MKIIGLTGSIAMGKSEVAKIFANHGIPVFDADKEVHALYDSQEGAALLQPLVPDVIVDGRINRDLLTKAVMADKALLEKLEPIVHATIAARRRSFLQQAKHACAKLVVLDVPLLLEKGGDTDVDLTIVVSAPPDVQRRRALSRVGMTEAKLDMILARQMPDAEKRKRADIVIHNDGSLDNLRRKAETVIRSLQ